MLELEDYIDECAKVFLKEQSRLFDEPVATDIDEAKEFLEEVFACVCENLDEVREYLDDLGMDVDGMTDEEIEDSLEVFKLSEGRYFVVEA